MTVPQQSTSIIQILSFWVRNVHTLPSSRACAPKLILGSLSTGMQQHNASPRGRLASSRCFMVIKFTRASGLSNDVRTALAIPCGGRCSMLPAIVVRC